IETFSQPFFSPCILRKNSSKFYCKTKKKKMPIEMQLQQIFGLNKGKFVNLYHFKLYKKKEKIKKITR
ncbi:hypothetical protein QJ127_02805, partial [Metamycoplasma hyosynoviae]|uniref:hypothetical protein n=1 Tax=Metamycoplasma hyosynoviae TaxID=29559 RepID=UPI00249B49CF